MRDSARGVVPTYKIIFLGLDGVGKTSLIGASSPTEMPPHRIGNDFCMCRIVVDEREVNLQLWRAIGDPLFEKVVSPLVASMHALFVIYDVSDRGSFDRAARLLEELRSRAHVCLLANKSDLADARRVSREEGERLAGLSRAGFCETSRTDERAFLSCLESVVASLLDEQPIFADGAPWRIPTSVAETEDPATSLLDEHLIFADGAPRSTPDSVAETEDPAPSRWWCACR